MKRLRILVLALVAAFALTLGSVGVSRADSGHTAKADIQSGNFFCGANTALPVIGFTNYNRVGDTVQIEYHLKDAIPNATYTVELWGNVCSFFGSVDTITTNSNGVANGQGSVTVPPSVTRFFATSFGPNGFNDTPAVTLTP
jgi:hypothetical protein